MRCSSSCPFYSPCSSITPALGRDVSVAPPSLPSPLLLPVLCCRAGAGSTAQTQQHHALKLLCHLDYWFCLPIIQFITSVAEINCQQKSGSTSCALRRSSPLGTGSLTHQRRNTHYFSPVWFSFGGQSFVPLLRPSARRPAAGWCVWMIFNCLLAE